jgi:formylglycine-generating enzyme required for sulfatase activity
VKLRLKICLNGSAAGNQYQGKVYKLTASYEAVQSSNNAAEDVWQMQNDDTAVPEFVLKTVPVPDGGIVFPSGQTDSEIAFVHDRFEIGETQVTYELWYEVRIWAESNGYFFRFKGFEGAAGEEGMVPSDDKRKPVTGISWRDSVIWMNALSEMCGLEPVYRTEEGTILRDSRGEITSGEHIIDSAVQTETNGYRMPTKNEYELARRWIGTTDPGQEGQYGYGKSLATERLMTISGENTYYWTPGNYASGATANTNNEAATLSVLWFVNKPNEVALKSANSLGLYDMCGNSGEWLFTPLSNSAYRWTKYSGWYYNRNMLQEGYFASDVTNYGTHSVNGSVNGIRIARTP